MQNLILKLESMLGPGRVKTQESMQAHTAFRSGGNAAIYLELDKLEDIIQVVRLAWEAGIAVTVLGAGTNSIVSSSGITGLVIKNNCRRFEVMRISGKMTGQQMDMSNAQLYCESGAILNQVVRYTIDQGFSGLEYQLGLPGTVGGGVRMNAMYSGKTESFVGDTVLSGKVLKRSGEIVEMHRDDFQFGFDFSSLQSSEDILLSVTFGLQPMDKKILWERGQTAVTYRMSEQPRTITTGYTYRNIKIIGLTESSSRLGIPDVQSIFEEIDAFSLSEKDVKIFEKRYNYLLNMGAADGVDVKTLIATIKQKAQEKCGVLVHFESHIIGA